MELLEHKLWRLAKELFSRNEYLVEGFWSEEAETDYMIIWKNLSFIDLLLKLEKTSWILLKLLFSFIHQYLKFSYYHKKLNSTT